MMRSRALSAAVLGLWGLSLAASGCTSLREIPRADFNTMPERRGVRDETREGLVYDFDFAAFTGDSLTGHRHRSDFKVPGDQTATIRLPLEDLNHLNTPN